MNDISRRIFAFGALLAVAACGASTSSPTASAPSQSTAAAAPDAGRPQFTDIHDEDCNTKPTRCDVDACNKWRISQGLPTADYQCNQLCNCAE